MAWVFLVVGAGIWIGDYATYAFWGIVSNKVGFYWRREYLRAILRQDAAWFESFDILELPSKITKECLNIENASGEKLANIFSGLATLIGGIIIAFVIGWKFALVCLAIIPIMGFGIVVLMIVMKNKKMA